MRSLPGPANYDNDRHICDDSGDIIDHTCKLLPFQTSQWNNLCEAVGIPANVEENSWKLSVKPVIPCTISDVKNGAADLRVHRVIVVVLEVVHAPSEAYALTVGDPTGSMPAFFGADTADLHPGLLIPGTAVILEGVAVFMSSATRERHLALHSRNVAAVFSAEKEAPSYPEEHF
mmetsp:Transcript_22561/g.32980  ORF Transcript_22561/g.32980 Transcript_22561/m.32980 type:complete len:175 (-) Transcript_22561:172-696(-)